MPSSIVDALLPEFDHEMATTRRVLERAPESQFNWKPHDKSMSLGELSGHLAHIPFWCTATLQDTFLDLAQYPRNKPPASRADLLKGFDERVATARARLASTTDPEFLVPWTLKHGDQEFFTMPRISVLRTFVMNHIVHHRGQLTVYLRLNNVPVPPIYGPTADEPQGG
jgi:uncharacterized damage-inducible protein DinB